MSQDQPSFDLSEAIKLADERTTDVYKIDYSYGFKITDPTNKTHVVRLESRLLAEWRLVEVHLCLLAAMHNIDIMDALSEVQDGQESAYTDPFHAPRPLFWTYYIPDPIKHCPSDDHMPFEAYDCLRKHEPDRSLELYILNPEYRNARDRIENKIRSHAISKTEERVSDLYQDSEGKWTFDHMLHNGHIFHSKHPNKLSAHNHRAIECLKIAANILRFDIRKQLDDYTYLLMKSDHYPDLAPDLGEWWRWLPVRGEVPRLPGGRDYFDVTLW